MNNMWNDIWSSQTITPVSTLTVLFSMLAAFAAGLIIALVYRRNYRGVMFSNNFTITLVMMTLIATPVVMCIQNSTALSLGMVGALSIVRFRTAVKDPLDTAYMFWALTMGILIGAGQFYLAMMAVVGIALLITVLVHYQSKGTNSYLLVVRMNEEGERAVAQLIGSIHIQKLKSKTVSAMGAEVTYELRVDKPDALLSRINNIPGVQDATLVSYQGEVA